MCIRGCQNDDTGHSVLKPWFNFANFTGVPVKEWGLEKETKVNP